MKINRVKKYLSSVVFSLISCYSYADTLLNENQFINENINENQSQNQNLIVKEDRIIVKSGENLIVPIALGFVNRIITPFANPQVISTSLSVTDDDGNGEIMIRKNVLYVSTNKDYPVSFFVTDKNSEELSISITLLPKKIPPREINFLLPVTTINNENISTEHSFVAKKREEQSDYLTNIKSIFRDLALRIVPPGFNMKKLTGSEKYLKDFCVGGNDGFEINFKDGQVLYGYNYKIYIGTVTNNSGEKKFFNESHCSDWDTLAVAVFPKFEFLDGEQSEIYVMKRFVQESFGFI